MCEQGDTVSMPIGVPAWLSRSGKAYTETVAVDRCIAALVRAINDGGIATVASCCGHGRITGNIILADGRELEIFPNRQFAQKYRGVSLYTPDASAAIAKVMHGLMNRVHEDIYERDPRGQLAEGQDVTWHRCTWLLKAKDEIDEILDGLEDKGRR